MLARVVLSAPATASKTTRPPFGWGPGSGAGAASASAGPIVEIYRATQVPLGRKVTIKALAASIVPSSPFAAALEREARLLGQLNHPNVVALYDFVRKGDRLWLVLEAIDGWSLAELLERAKHF